MDSRLKLTISEDKIEPRALEQIYGALRFPFLKKLAIMPDVHAGYDLPIGGVALLDDHVWPGAVGYDIGCGMCHVNTGYKLNELNDLVEVYDKIIKHTPLGFSTKDQPNYGFDKFVSASGFSALTDAVNFKASIQTGTLGGGNHFIEIGVNEEGEVGITIHSGSRRPGWLIGDFYMRMTGNPINIKSEIAQAYIKDMKWAISFANLNRYQMLRDSLYAMGIEHKKVDTLCAHAINENHNHAEVTSEGILHRKGATQANKDQYGVIPANMHSGVWITRGLGNDEFLSSASHGAGRKMSRRMARKELTMSELVNQMENIITPPLNNLLDESPDAYKDITEVIAAQEGILIEVVDHFKPVLVVKG